MYKIYTRNASLKCGERVILGWRKRYGILLYIPHSEATV
jgi:hypothetical protein